MSQTETLDQLGMITHRWLCTKCGDVVDGTPQKYLNFCREHPKKKGCGVVLINEIGDTVAHSLAEAQHQGIFRKPYGDRQEPEAPGKSKKGVKDSSGPPSAGQPLLQGYFRTETVALDPKVKLYHQVFMDEGLVPSDATLGQFILGVIETLLEMTGRKLAIVQITGD